MRIFISQPYIILAFVSAENRNQRMKADKKLLIYSKNPVLCDPLPLLSKQDVKRKAKHKDPWRLYRDTMLFTHGKNGIPPLFYGKIRKASHARDDMMVIKEHVGTMLQMVEEGHVRVLESVVYLTVTLSVMVWGGDFGEDIVEDVLSKRKQLLAAVSELRTKKKKPLFTPGKGLKVSYIKI